MKVKICGIMEPQHAVWAVEAGADFLGFVFAPSRRSVTGEKVADIGAFLTGKGLRNKVALVGVFVNENPAVVNEAARTCGLDCVQLSGDESWDYCRLVERPVIKAVKLAPNFSSGETAASLKRDWAKIEGNMVAILVEPLVQGRYGGSGVQLDWQSMEELSGAAPLLLAGGLTPENVRLACRLVRPWGVDVSSGVETDGVKDEGKIKAFVAAARRSG